MNDSPTGCRALSTKRKRKKAAVRRAKKTLKRLKLPRRLLLAITTPRRMSRHGCQMAKTRFSDRMCLALRASGLWLRYATLQNLIPSFPWIAPPTPSTLTQSKERKGSNFAIWQHCEQASTEGTSDTTTTKPDESTKEEKEQTEVMEVDKEAKKEVSLLGVQMCTL